MVVELMHVCVKAKAPGGLCLERDVPSSRRALQMVKGEGEELPPPGQIGRMKLFESGRHRLTGVADGLVCMTQSGETVNWPPDSRNA